MTKQEVFGVLEAYKAVKPETPEDKIKKTANVNYLIGYADGKGWKYPSKPVAGALE